MKYGNPALCWEHIELRDSARWSCVNQRNLRLRIQTAAAAPHTRNLTSQWLVCWNRYVLSEVLFPISLPSRENIWMLEAQFVDNLWTALNFQALLYIFLKGQSHQIGCFLLPILIHSALDFHFMFTHTAFQNYKHSVRCRVFLEAFHKFLAFQSLLRKVYEGRPRGFVRRYRCKSPKCNLWDTGFLNSRINGKKDQNLTKPMRMSPQTGGHSWLSTFSVVRWLSRTKFCRIFVFSFDAWIFSNRWVLRKLCVDNWSLAIVLTWKNSLFCC